MSTYTYYLATHFPNRLMARIVREWINKVPEPWPEVCQVTLNCNSSWLNPGLDWADVGEAARVDFGEVNSADFLIALSPLAYGSTAEVACALGANKPIILLVDPMCYEQGNDDNLVINMLEPVNLYRTGTLPRLVATCEGELKRGIKTVCSYLDARSAN